MTKNTSVILQPEYVEHFQCDGTKCNAKCCKNWRITIDINTYRKYQRIKNHSIRNKILSSMEPDSIKAGYVQIKLNSEGACPLICSDSLCYIQRNLGADALSNTCSLYPRIVRHIGDCQLRTLSMTCPVAAEAALFSEHGMDIKNLLSGNEDALWKFALKSKNCKIDADTNLAANVILGSLSILQNTYYTFEQRMVVLGLFLDKADELKALPNSAEAIFETALFYNGDEFATQVQEIFANWTFYPTAHGQLLEGILASLQDKTKISNIFLLIRQVHDYTKNYPDFHSLTQNTFGTAIDKYWQQEFICRGFPFCMEGSFLHNYFAYIIAYKIWEMCLYHYCCKSEGQISRNEFLNLVTRYSENLNHLGNFIHYLVQYTAPFEKEPIKLMQVLLRLK